MPGALDGLHDPAGHGADVGAAVSADLRFVAHAAQAHPRELAAQRPGNALAQGSLSDTGGSDEAEDGAHGLARLSVLRAVLLNAALLEELAHGKKLDDPVLDLLQIVVVLVEHLARVDDVQLVLAGDAPGQLHHPVQVRLDHGVLGRLRGQSSTRPRS